MSSAPVDARNLEPEAVDDGDMPRTVLTRRRAILAGVFVVAVVAFLYFGLPQLAGLQETLDRVRQGDPWWLLLCFVFEIVSFAGYVWLFRAVFVHGSNRIDWRASYEITLAGLAATRLFAAAGAGGAALTAWALRRSGMRARTVASRMVAQYVLLYAVYMLSLVFWGVGMYVGIFAGSDEFALTMVPAIFGLIVLAIGAAAALVPTQIDRSLARWADGSGRLAHLVAQVSKAPAAVSEGVREALRLIREREWGVAGAVIWWYFDMATLWAAFHAFGEPPPFGVIVLAYFIGMIANLLPLPGGLGGVDGGMIGAFVAFGVPGSLAIVAVLTYRAFAFWLPTIPGAVAYLQLRKTVQVWKGENREEITLAMERLEASDGAPTIPATIQNEVTLPTTPKRTTSP